MADVLSDAAAAAPTTTRSRSPESEIPIDNTETAMATATSATATTGMTTVATTKGAQDYPQETPASAAPSRPGDVPDRASTTDGRDVQWSGGDRESSQASQTAAKGRCNVAKDSGYTLADNVSGSYFCLFFARGLCPKGSDCPYLHRLPTITDIFNPNVDCFGRDKFSDYRDDMAGVGSFLRPNRTVYVGRIHVSDDIEEVVARHFAEWGQIERTRVLNTRGVAFITYTNEANAQFAKEAMANQSLDHEEILNVRWATVDPNPMAQAREARRIEEQAAAAIRAILPADYIAELEGRDPNASKRRRIEGGFGLQGYDAPDEVWYARAQDQEQQQQQQQQLEEAPAEVAPAAESTASGGVLSSATLAALARQRKRSNGLVMKTAKESKPAAALVDYGSDSDDDGDEAS